MQRMHVSPVKWSQMSDKWHSLVGLLQSCTDERTTKRSQRFLPLGDPPTPKLVQCLKEDEQRAQLREYRVGIRGVWIVWRVPECFEVFGGYEPTSFSCEGTVQALSHLSGIESRLYRDLTNSLML